MVPMLDFRHRLAGIVTFSLVGFAAAPAAAITSPPNPATDEPGFMEFVIDHHFSALRMTELAAGTANTAPTPGFPPTPAKGTDPLVFDISTMNNMMQREEISTLQTFLQSFYNISYQPQLAPSGQTLINVLDQAPAGNPFNVAFLEAFSDHHFSLLGPAEQCAASAPHGELRQVCSDMVASQSRDIMEMGSQLCEQYGICGFRPVALAPDQTTPPPIDRIAVSEPPSASLLGGALLLALLYFGAARSRPVSRRASPI